MSVIIPDNYKVLGQGISGIVYYPALPCKQFNDFDSTGLVSKLTTKKNAEKELEAASDIKRTIPNHAIYPVYVCESEYSLTKGGRTLDTLVFSKFGGITLNKYTDMMEIYAYDELSPEQLKDASNNINLYESLSDALKELHTYIVKMNEQSFYHNDISNDNIVYLDDEKRAFLIDFDRSGPKHETVVSVHMPPMPTDDDIIKNMITSFDKELNMIREKILQSGGSNNEQEEQKQDDTPYMYPVLSDPNFIEKISNKVEFSSTQYNGHIDQTMSVEAYANKLSSAEYELQPHQLFIKNFLSIQTSYNSLLLFHGLGSGKTCSAIGVCEEMRQYLKHMEAGNGPRTTMGNKIIIIASENVRNNFKTQLFDKTKLVEQDGLWSMNSCTGNALLKEINPIGLKNIPKDTIVSHVSTIIKTYYTFYGYEEFANIISRLRSNTTIKNALERTFENSLIIVDEVHNIRMTEDGKMKKTGAQFEYMVRHVPRLRLLLLSATPMFNSYKEIIWLINLMNIADGRSTISVSDIFTSNGNFTETGKELFIQKITGYISAVKGENPFTFPYRIYPSIFSLSNSTRNERFIFPKIQMDDIVLPQSEKINYLDLYVSSLPDCNNCGGCQRCMYSFIIRSFKRDFKASKVSDENTSSDVATPTLPPLNYSMLQIPIMSLIISYPIPNVNLDQLIRENREDNLFIDNVEPEPEQEKIQEQKDFVGDQDKLDSESESDSDSESDIELDFDILPDQDDEDPDNYIIEIQELDQTQRQKLSREISGGMVDVERDNNDDIMSEYDADTDISLSDYETDNSSDSELDLTDDDDDDDDADDIITENIPERSSLTGSRGLLRVLDVSEKGKYSYNEEYAKSFPRFFSTNMIGKYSWKIKNVIDTFSDGISLIYSQYIEGGLIPMALALEEMGFSRYNSASLFETPPSPLIDYKLKPLSNNNSKASYIIISGNSILSPKNDANIKAAVAKENANGENIKAILISTAGSEGIDLKYIRQVHILDPWYNMSRIEQVIGRAVRNMSHKALPFVSRNVQIFMYSTMFENEEIELADMHIYRTAEKKAIQIGKITRILKETAVDCIINQGQLNFTQETMREMNTGSIRQILSNGQELLEFKIGDAPNSASCDYMDTCKYNAVKSDGSVVQIDNNSNKDITTNSTSFVFNNADTIIRRIKQLFTLEFFYHRDMIIQLVQVTTKYPNARIYAALTIMIENPNEVLIDKYGRHGSLINVDEYYFFQPSTMSDTSLSVFDRSIPATHDRIAVEFNMENENSIETDYDNNDIINIVPTEPDVNKTTNANDNVDESKISTIETIGSTRSVSAIIKDMKIKYETAFSYMKDPQYSPVNGNKLDPSLVWFKNFGIVIHKLSSGALVIPGLEYETGIRPLVGQLLTEHMVESILFNKKLQFINYLYNPKSDTTAPWTQYARKYFDNRSIQVSPTKTYMLSYTLSVKTNTFTRRFLMFNHENSEWNIVYDDGPLLEYLENKPEIMNFYTSEETEKQLLDENPNLGFIGYEKNNDYMIFKRSVVTKNKTAHNIGARCDEMNKQLAIKNINGLKSEWGDIITKDMLKQHGIYKPMLQSELCVFYEIIMRLYHAINCKNMEWTMTPEIAILRGFTSSKIKE
jgi:hypothetical protein